MKPVRLEDLADELFLQIISYLNPPTLATLSLVNKRYRRIAQGELYKAPSLVSIDEDGNNCSVVSTIPFCQTLVRRPDLAKMVRRLVLHIPSHSSNSRMDSELPADVLSSALDQIRSFSMQLDVSKWIEAIEDSWPYGEVTAWTGLLLSLVPNLLRLEFRECNDCYISFTVPELFGLETNDDYMDMGLLEGLASLETLIIPTSGFTNWDWCILPNLSTLR